MKISRAYWVLFGIAPLILSVGRPASCQEGFGAYYTEIFTGSDWDTFSRTDVYADVIVRVPEAGGEINFWRGNSYLPLWKTVRGSINLTEIVPRSGDGIEPMTDRVNIYSHVAIVSNTPSAVVVDWRYLKNFSAGNPNKNVSPYNFVDEVFTISPEGRINRVVREGCSVADDWDNLRNRTVQTLQLGTNGVFQISRINPIKSLRQRQVHGNPRRVMPVAKPVVRFCFDEGIGNFTEECIMHTRLPVGGPKTYWKEGVSGTALEFDGYHTEVILPSEKVPNINGGSLTVNAWIALGAYPWNWAPIVQQGDDAGFFLGVNSHGYPGFMVEVDGVWEQLILPDNPPFADTNHLSLFRWHNLAGVYNKEAGVMSMFVDGIEIASKKAGRGGLQATNTALRLGKAGFRRVPTEGTHDTLPSNFGLDALMDEVEVYNQPLTPQQLREAYQNSQPGNAVVTTPDMQPRHFPQLNTGGKFGAVYAHLPYYETWDNLFPFGDYSDVVVGFDRSPTKFLFWRGVSYVPLMVNESNQCFTEEFNETGFCPDAPGDCEPMSDKQCYASHVRVLENNPARVVVEWRYRLANPEQHWAFYDAKTGWGDISDWLFYIYPDGVASVRMRLYTSRPDYGHEWDEQIAVFGPGQHPESVVCKTPVMTLVNRSGRATDYDWNPNPPDPRYTNTCIQMIHFRAKYSPFAVQNFTGGDIYGGERTWYSVFPSWNHWPISQIDSSGRNASFPDRASHSSISHVFLPMYQEHSGNVPYQECTLMEGMTDLPAVALTNLAASWLDAPATTNLAGGTTQGYHQPSRAYVFNYEGKPLTFQICATAGRPIQNLCFEIHHWKSRQAIAALKVNGSTPTGEIDFRQGVNLDTDGTSTLIVWVGLSASTTQTFEVREL